MTLKWEVKTIFGAFSAMGLAAVTNGTLTMLLNVLLCDTF